jgi:hypothetical protein
MIKIGVFGISEETITLTGRIKKEKGIFLTGTSLRASFPEDPFLQKHSYLNSDPKEMIMHSDVLLFADPSPDEMVFIRAALRMSRPLFFMKTLRLSEEALKEIYDLATEGEVHVHCYNPLRDHPLFSEAADLAGRPLFTEIIRRWKNVEQPEERITDTLIYSLEGTLHMNRTRPRRPAVGAVFHPESRTGLAHIQMEFDDGMTALIRHEVQEEEAFFCNISGNNGKVSVDLSHNLLIQRDIAGTLKEKRKKLPGGTDALYHAWQHFLQCTSSPSPALLEERITTLRILTYILEKIRIKAPSPLPAEKNW